ncbi:MAG: TIGR00297 family protein [Methanotrichaceae archaeon]|nr:TIGR00297 family protein [Methanotrichaceae archaeon]
MRREHATKLAIGSLALLLPFAGILTVVPLFVFALFDSSSRLLSTSLAMLLIIREILGYFHIYLPLYVIAISFVASTFAPFAAKRFHAMTGSIIYVLITVILGFPLATFVSMGNLAPEKILFICLLGGLSGAFLYNVSLKRDFTVPFGTCMAMWLFSFDHPLPAFERILIICLFGLSLGLVAYWAKAADSDAVLSETLISLLVILFGGLSWFLLLLAFYLLGGGFTKYSYAYKRNLGIAQSQGGVRGYKNVYSNSLVPLSMAICYGIYENPIFVYAFISSVATAAGDTLASEIGETSKSKPIMITSFRPVEPGIDGGVTFLGEAAALFGSLIIGLLATAMSMTGYAGILIATIGGFMGTNFDSLLGATVQSHGKLTNNGVNLFATLFGALLGAGFWWILQII